MIQFRVAGRYATEGSLRPVMTRGGKLRNIPQNPNHLKVWRAKVAYSARIAAVGRELAGQPVNVRIVFTRARPASHRYADGSLRENAPAWPTRHGHGDVDKLARAVLDALQDVHVIEDDVHVVGLMSSKRWWREDGAVITIEEAGDPPP